MNLQHVNVKIFVAGPLAIDAGEFIRAFHRWVADQSMDELLVDVADYRHVPAGPGVVLIGHEADYSLDQRGHRWGLRYNRKAVFEGSNGDRFQQAISSAAKACQRLEDEFAELQFSRHEFQLFINDRALAPNTPETFAACKPELESFLAQRVADGDFRLEHDHTDPRKLFSVTIRFAQPIDLSRFA
jgi:hypothetical protein